MERAARESSLGVLYTIQAVADLRQPELVALVREAVLVVIHEQVTHGSAAEVAAHLRRQTNRPVIVVVEAPLEEHTVEILASGADDCIAHNLSSLELVARLRAHLRRDQEYAAAATPPAYELQDITVDSARHEVNVRGSAVDLTPREFELLECLAQAAGRPVRRGELLERVWGYNSAMSTRTLDVHVGRLRQKIEQDPRDPRLIVTIPGVGYKLAT